MLTAKKRAFIDNYKLTRNASKSALAAGYSPKNAPQYGSELLKDPDVSRILSEWEIAERALIEQKIIERKALLKPDKGTYIERTFEKAETVTHAPTASKYWELAGKASGFIGSNDASSDNAPVFNIIAKELHIDKDGKISINNNEVIDAVNEVSTDVSST